MPNKNQLLRNKVFASGLSLFLIAASTVPTGIVLASDHSKNAINSVQDQTERPYEKNTAEKTVQNEERQPYKSETTAADVYIEPSYKDNINTESYFPAKKKEGFIKENGKWIFYQNNVINSKEHDIVHGSIDGVSAWYYIENGIAKTDYTGISNNAHGWWYIKNGKVDFHYNGFSKNQNGWWYCENGKITFKRHDVTYGTVNGINGWWNVHGSKVIFNESVEHNSSGWWYIKNGKVDFSYNGFAKNHSGWWYCENGKVTFNRNEVTYGTVEKQNGWWNVHGSQVVFNESVEHNSSGWWYVKNGKVDFSYNGFAKNHSGWWYVSNGKVSFKRYEVTYGTINGQSGWWNVQGSKVIFNESVEPNSSGWWYVKNGKVDFGYDGLANNTHGWWYIKNGKVDFKYTGDASNIHGIWRIENGKVNFNYNIATLVDGKWSGYVKGKKDPSAAVVAHASKDENGKFWEGKAGDQTKEEVYCRTWNDHPWEYVIRAKSPAMAEKIATAMEHAVSNDNIGYDMYQRNTLYHAASTVGWDPGKVTGKVECDCSSLVTVACLYAGVNRTAIYQNNSCSYTGNLRKRLLATGQFNVYNSSDYTKSSEKLKRGDILLEEGEHTAVIVKDLSK